MMNQMTDYEEQAVTDDSKKYLTEVEIRALLDSTLGRLTTPIYLAAGSISGTGDDPWSLTPEDMNIKLGLNSEQSIQGWANTMTFSAVDADTVEWTSGAITLSSGKIYTITAGNTGNMSALTYIYLDVGTSETVLQTTTTAATSVGTGKILVAVAQNNSDTASDATFQVFGGSGGVTVLVDNIAANSASTNEFITNTAQIKDAVISSAKIIDLAANKINVGTLTGFIIQSATSGLRVRQSSAEYLQFMNGDTQKGKIGLTSADSNSLKIDTSDDIYFTVNGVNKIKFDSSGDINFASDGREIAWAGGRKISADGSTITANGYFVATETIRADGYSAKISSTTYDGQTDSDKLVTGVAQSKSGGYVTNVQYKEREIKFKGGIFWKFEGESGWTDAA